MVEHYQVIENPFLLFVLNVGSQIIHDTLTLYIVYIAVRCPTYLMASNSLLVMALQD